MEDPPTTSSFQRKTEPGTRIVDDASTLTQRLNIPDTNPLLFGACTKPLVELSRTTVVKLRVNESANGFYVLLRTLSPTVTIPVKTDFGENALVLAEDHVKNRITCCLYGHVHLRSEPELKELLPVDAVFALKEPFLIACTEQQFVVAVVGPSDLVVVGRSHVLYKDAEALGWREKTENEGLQLTYKWIGIGLALFQEQKYYDACDAYLFALNNCTDTSTELLLNKNLAASFFLQGCYESGLSYALKVLKMEPFSEIGLYYAGRAQYELREYTKARFYFETLIHTFPSNENYMALVVRCEERLREYNECVDIFKLYQASLIEVTTLIDHGPFYGNIVFRPGPVRGAFATQDMDPGTLIMVEKALVTTSGLEIGNFMRTAFRAVLSNPQTMGRKLCFLPGGYTINDDNRRIFCDEINELEPFVDVRRLHLILRQNIFRNKINTTENAPLMYHVYEAASRFEHSCLSNCSLHVFKNVVTVRTCASVLKGEELFLRYYPNNLSFREKQEAFRRSGLTCSCSLCALDKMELTKVHDHRQKLKSKFDAQMALRADINFSAEERLLPIVDELVLSYSNRDSLRLLLFIVYHDLAKLVDRSTKDWKEKLSFYVERGLESVGLSTTVLLSCAVQDNPEIPHFLLMPEVLFDFAGLVAEKEYCSRRVDLAKKWVNLILLLETIYRGGNMQMLKRRFLDFKKLPSLLSAFA